MHIHINLEYRLINYLTKLQNCWVYRSYTYTLLMIVIINKVLI